MKAASIQGELFFTHPKFQAVVDRFVQHGNDAGQNLGQVVVVQSTAGSRAEKLGAGGFHVVVRGYENGDLIDRVEAVKSVRLSAPKPLYRSTARIQARKLMPISMARTDSTSATRLVRTRFR